MQIKIPSETYVRLSYVAGREAPFNCIVIEPGLAMATNRKILAVQEIENDNPGVHLLVVDPMLVEACRMDAFSDGDLTFDVIDGTQWGTATTTGGYAYPGNAVYQLEGPSELFSWRTCIPSAADYSAKSNGFMFLDTELMWQLGQSAPSKRFVFPQHVDSTKPVLVRDYIDPSWFGVFLAQGRAGDVIRPPQYPDWFK